MWPTRCRARQDRRAVAAIDGGGRSAHRRPDARLQQSADRHQQLARAACHPRPQGRIGEIDRYVDAAQSATRRAASLAHRLLAFPAARCSSPNPPTSTAWSSASTSSSGVRLDRRSLSSSCPTGALADAGRSEPARECAAQPLHQRARRDAFWRQADHRNRQPPSRRPGGEGTLHHYASRRGHRPLL